MNAASLCKVIFYFHILYEACRANIKMLSELPINFARIIKTIQAFLNMNELLNKVLLLMIVEKVLIIEAPNWNNIIRIKNAISQLINL